jgi:hypothetical protein
MSGWEIFTWINVAILGVGSITVFVRFLMDLPELLSRATESGDGDSRAEP